MSESTTLALTAVGIEESNPIQVDEKRNENNNTK